MPGPRLLILLPLLLAAVLCQQEFSGEILTGGTALLRVINLAPATLAQPVDVYLNGNLTFAGLEFATPQQNYTLLPPAAYTVTLFLAGSSRNGTSLAETSVKLDGAAYTLVLASDVGANSSIVATLFLDDLTAPAARYQRIRLINAIGAGAVSITLNQKNAAVPFTQDWTQIGTNSAGSLVQLPASEYTVDGTGPGNTSIVFDKSVTLIGSTVNTLFTYVQPKAPAPFTFLVSCDFSYAPPPPVSLVRIINAAIPDPSVGKPTGLSLESNGRMVIRNVSYGRISEYVAVNSSQPDLALHFGGQIVWTSPKSLGQYKNWTIVLTGSVKGNSIMPMMYSDDLTPIPSAPKLRLLNVNVGVQSVRLSGSGVNVSAEYQVMTPYQLASSAATSTLAVIGQGAASDLQLSLRKKLKAGVSYTVVVFGQDGTSSDNVTAPFAAVLATDYPQQSGKKRRLTKLQIGLIIGGGVLGALLVGVIVIASVIFLVGRNPALTGYEPLGEDPRIH